MPASDPAPIPASVATQTPATVTEVASDPAPASVVVDRPLTGPGSGRKAGPGRPRKDGKANKSGFKLPGFSIKKEHSTTKKPASTSAKKATTIFPRIASFPNLGREPSAIAADAANAKNAAFAANGGLDAGLSAAPAPKEPKPKKPRHSWYYETVPADEDKDAKKLEEKRRSAVVLYDNNELKRLEEQGKRGSLRRASSIRPVKSEA